MKVKEANSLIQLIRETSIFDLFIVSIIILPIYLTSWNVLLKQYNNKLWENETLVFFILIGIYFIAITIMKFGQSKNDKNRTALQKLTSYYNLRRWTRMSFERIQSSIDSSYSEDFLKKLVNEYPTEITTGKIKGGKIAIVILDQETED